MSELQQLMDQLELTVKKIESYKKVINQLELEGLRGNTLYIFYREGLLIEQNELERIANKVVEVGRSI